MNQPAPVVEPIVSAHQHDCQHIRRAPDHRVPERRCSRAVSVLADQAFVRRSGRRSTCGMACGSTCGVPAARRAIPQLPQRSTTRGQDGAIDGGTVSRHHIGVGCAGPDPNHVVRGHRWRRDGRAVRRRDLAMTGLANVSPVSGRCVASTGRSRATTPSSDTGFNVPACLEGDASSVRVFRW